MIHNSLTHGTLLTILAAATFTLAGIVGPGIALQRVLRVRVDAALVIPLGAAFAAAAYWTALASGSGWLFLAFVVAVNLVHLRGHVPWSDGPRLRGALPPLAGVLAFLAFTQFGWNRLNADGAFVLDPLVPFDTAFHVGLVHELTHSYPPQVPGVSGFPLGYHLGTDLVRAAAERWAGIHPYDWITRVDPALWGLALVLLLRATAWRLGAPPLAVAALPWTLVATDFSFLLWRSPAAHWWADLLRGNILLSLALANPVLPALALALGCLVALARDEAGEGASWRVVAAGQAAAVPFFKVFMGAHLLLGLGVAWLAAPRAMRRALAFVAAPAALATALLAFGQGGRTVEVAWAPFDLVQVTRDSLGLPTVGPAAFALWATAWLAASLGVRALGIGPAFVALRHGSTMARVLAAMALAAWPLGLAMRVSAPVALPGQKIVNDAAYLVEQGGPLLWIFTIAALAGLAPRRAAVAALAVAGALSLPSTVQYAIQKRRWPNEALPAPMVRAMRALGAASRPGEVVLQRPGGRYPPAPVVLIGRRVPYERFTPWLTQFAAPADLERRHEAVYAFFRTRDRAEAVAIARALDARYVVLYDQERLRFDAAGLLEPIHEEPGARVYRLRAQ